MKSNQPKLPALPTCERCRHFQFAFGETGFCQHPRLTADGYKLTEALDYCPKWKPIGSKSGMKNPRPAKTKNHAF